MCVFMVIGREKSFSIAVTQDPLLGDINWWIWDYPLIKICSFLVWHFFPKWSLGPTYIFHLWKRGWFFSNPLFLVWPPTKSSQLSQRSGDQWGENLRGMAICNGSGKFSKFTLFPLVENLCRIKPLTLSGHHFEKLMLKLIWMKGWNTEVILY